VANKMANCPVIKTQVYMFYFARFANKSGASNRLLPILAIFVQRYPPLANHFQLNIVLLVIVILHTTD